MNQTYITYLTSYKGKLLPPYYIGSTSLENFNKGYHGSVQSKKYGRIWKQEIKDNLHLFETIIVSKHRKRKCALSAELKLQKNHDVVNNPLFVNMALARIDGYHGSDTSGKNNGFYGKRHSEETINSLSGKNNSMFKGYYHTPFGRLEAASHIIQHTTKLSCKTLRRWVTHPNKIISSISIGKSKYLTKSMLGKTFKDVGFWFESI